MVNISESAFGPAADRFAWNTHDCVQHFCTISGSCQNSGALPSRSEHLWNASMKLLHTTASAYSSALSTGPTRRHIWIWRTPPKPPPGNLGLDSSACLHAQDAEEGSGRTALADSAIFATLSPPTVLSRASGGHKSEAGVKPQVLHSSGQEGGNAGRARLSSVSDSLSASADGDSFAHTLPTSTPATAQTRPLVGDAQADAQPRGLSPICSSRGSGSGSSSSEAIRSSCSPSQIAATTAGSAACVSPVKQFQIPVETGSGACAASSHLGLRQDRKAMCGVGPLGRVALLSPRVATGVLAALVASGLLALAAFVATFASFLAEYGDPSSPYVLANFLVRHLPPHVSWPSLRASNVPSCQSHA
jgi:hypothetical protein